MRLWRLDDIPDHEERVVRSGDDSLGDRIKYAAYAMRQILMRGDFPGAPPFEG